MGLFETGWKCKSLTEEVFASLFRTETMALVPVHNLHVEIPIYLCHT